MCGAGLVVGAGAVTSQRSGEMREFWDDRAREDAFFFVDSRLKYRDPDVERFWQEGEADLDLLLDAVGVSLENLESVLDIGCGLGRLTRAIAARVKTVYALDISAEMLERARKLNAHLENVEWMQGNGLDLRPVGDGSLDACVSHVVFQHIPDPEITFSYVREMARVLKVGGWSAFQISNDPAVHRVRSSRRPLQRVAELRGRAPRGCDEEPWLGSMIELDELESRASEVHLAVERVVNPGTQLCLVLLRRDAAPPSQG